MAWKEEWVSNTFEFTLINMLPSSNILRYLAWTYRRPGTAPWPDPSSSWSSMTSKYSGEQHQHVGNQNDVHQNDQSWRCWGATFWRIISLWQAFNCSVNYINFVRWLYQLCEIKDNCVSANSIRRVFSLTLFQRWCNELLTPLIQAQELYNPVCGTYFSLKDFIGYKPLI